jgi:hypothetical protein
MEGIVVRMKSGSRVVLTLEQIMQSIAVEVDESDLDLVGASGIFGADTANLSLDACLQGV